MSSSDFDKQKWNHELQREDAKRAHDAHYTFTDDTNEAAIKSGEFALKTALALNGGACATTLAFISQLAGKDKLSLSQVSFFSNGLSFFAWGIAAAAIGAGAAYFTNLFTATAAATYEMHWDFPWVRPTGKTKWWRCARYGFQGIAFLSGVAAIILFIWGVNEIRGSLVGLK